MPTSVERKPNSAAHATTVTTASTPSALGCADTRAYVARGEKMTPAIRASRPGRPAGVDGCRTSVSVIAPSNVLVLGYRTRTGITEFMLHARVRAPLP